MFSGNGIRKSLEKLNPGAPVPADLAAAVKRLAEAYVTQLERCLEHSPSRLVVAIHNNRDNAHEPKGFSVRSYHASASNPTIHADQDVDNFIIATREDDYHMLRVIWNAFWMRGVQDDLGSLSERFAELRYVNVEAQHGDAETQKRMLASVADLAD